LSVAAVRPRVDRGPVQRAILALLSEQPRHGYELHGLFEATVGGHWPLNTGQIYSSLDRLARDGLVEEAGYEKGGGPDKRLWTITAEGRGELAGWFGTAVPREYRLRDELYLKLMLAIGSRAEDPHRVLQIQRRELFRELHGLTATRNDLNPKMELPQILLMDGAIMHTEAELRWLDMIEVRLHQLREQPMPAPVQRPRGRPKKAVSH
jgi:DNA-binding PadR family transcriptional regulator